MLYACWSVKGGSGATVLSASLALARANEHPAGVLLVDLAGDLPATLAVTEPHGAGLADWVAAGRDVPADGLARLEVEVTPRVRLLPRGEAPWPARADAGLLLATLAGDPRLVVADCGTLPLHAPPELPLTIAAGATHSVLVVRPCYLGLRRAQQAPLRPSRLVVVAEPGRALSTPDVESVLGVPLLAELPHDVGLARAVDAGLLTTRMPRSVARCLRSVA